MTIPRWYIDELGHAGPEHLDPAYVAGYDRKTGVDPEAELTLLRDLGLRREHTLVDLGTGTGALPLIAAPHCRRVVAVDVSEPMLAVLRQRAKQMGIQTIDCVRAGFLTYRHEGAPADIVYTRHALHHLPDFWKVIALRRIAAMLKPGGILYLRDLVYTVGPDQVDDVIERWLVGASPTPEAGWTRAELETHVREEHSTFSWLLEAMLERTGFRVEARQEAGSGTYLALACVRVQP